MAFKDICMEVVSIAEGLDDGSISFTYDKQASALKMGHPSEILMDLLCDVEDNVLNNSVPTQKQVDALLKGLKRFQRTFKVREIGKPVVELTEYWEHMR